MEAYTIGCRKPPRGFSGQPRHSVTCPRSICYTKVNALAQEGNKKILRGISAPPSALYVASVAILTLTKVWCCYLPSLGAQYSAASLTPGPTLRGTCTACTLLSLDKTINPTPPFNSYSSPISAAAPTPRIVLL